MPAKAGDLPTWTECDATPPGHVAATLRPVHGDGCTFDPINLVRLGSPTGAHACHWVAIVPAARADGLRPAAGVPAALVDGVSLALGVPVVAVGTSLLTAPRAVLTL